MYRAVVDIIDLYRLGHKMKTLAEFNLPIGDDLAPMDYVILRDLLENGHSAFADSRKRLFLLQPDHTKKFDRLQANGYVKTWKEPADKRAKIARLTPKGIKAARRTFELAHLPTVTTDRERRLGEVLVRLGDLLPTRLR
jgi:DNA-binding MarR family transcriptional regulator